MISSTNPVFNFFDKKPVLEPTILPPTEESAGSGENAADEAVVSPFHLTPKLQVFQQTG